MFSLRIGAHDLLPGRLNADAYSPTFLANRTTMLASGLRLSVLSEVVRAPINNSIRDVSDALDAADAVIPMYRPADIREGWCDSSTAPRLPASFESQHAKSRVESGDIVLGIAGSIAVAGRVPAGFPIGNVNGSSARIAPKPSWEGYLLSYLNCRFGRSALLQWAVGSVQRHLNLEDLPDVEVPDPCEDVRRYIGSKVRQAETLREWAREGEKGARARYGAELHARGIKEIPHQKTFKTQLKERLDPEYYQPRYASVLDAPWIQDSTQPLGDLVVSGSYGCLPESGTYGTGTARLLRATDLDDCATNPNAGVRVPGDQVAKKALVGDCDLLLEIKGGISRCIVAHGHAVGCYVNGTIYRFKSSIDPWYLSLHLTGLLKQLYCDRESVNNIILYLNLDAISRLPVLRVGTNVEAAIGTEFKFAVLAAGMSRALVAAARLLVEALIERKVTEAELIAASRDADADRALLARLKDDGLDGTGAPLFPDLNALADLLTEAIAPKGETL